MVGDKNKMNNKFSEIKSNPAKLFALVYPYVLVIGLLFGIMYMKNLNIISRQTVPPKLQDTTDQKDLPIVQPKTIPPINIMEVSKPTQLLVEEGEKLFATICSSCHGTEGKGDGPAAGSLNPSPRNFTSNDGWKNGRKISEIFTTLSEGIPGSGMIAYDYLTPEERISLAHYIRSKFISNPPLDTQDDLAALDRTYNLSEGKEISAQIPVEAAMYIMEKESDQKMQNIITAFNKILADKNEEGSKIFNKVTNDKMRALTLLGNANGWKQNENKFISSIVNTANQNGFNGEVFELNSSDWNILYNYMNKFF
ncbi:MAG: cytochrome c [Ignavibacteriaceae bacterium]